MPNLLEKRDPSLKNCLDPVREFGEKNISTYARYQCESTLPPRMMISPLHRCKRGKGGRKERKKERKKGKKEQGERQVSRWKGPRFALLQDTHRAFPVSLTLPHPRQALGHVVGGGDRLQKRPSCLPSRICRDVRAICARACTFTRRGGPVSLCVCACARDNEEVGWLRSLSSSPLFVNALCKSFSIVLSLLFLFSFLLVLYLSQFSSISFPWEGRVDAERSRNLSTGRFVDIRRRGIFLSFLSGFLYFSSSRGRRK